MARFDVYRHPDAKQRVTTPFLLDVQNEYISGLQTRVVLPLRRAERVAIPLRDLNPALEVEGVAVILDAAAIDDDGAPCADGCGASRMAHGVFVTTLHAYWPVWKRRLDAREGAALERMPRRASRRGRVGTRTAASAGSAAASGRPTPSRSTRPGSSA